MSSKMGRMIHEFDPNCADCRPAMLDPETGQSLPSNHPHLVTATCIWESLPIEDKKALHRVWVKNSRAPDDMRVVDLYITALKRAIESQPS